MVRLTMLIIRLLEHLSPQDKTLGQPADKEIKVNPSR
jgi:hypothetical protein